MRITALLCCFSLLYGLSPCCLAEDYKPGTYEYAPKGEVSCSWSKMRSQEYATCLKRKEYFGKMTEQQKEEYNSNVVQQETLQRLRGVQQPAGKPVSGGKPAAPKGP